MTRFCFFSLLIFQSSKFARKNKIKQNERKFVGEMNANLLGHCDAHNEEEKKCIFLPSVKSLQKNEWFYEKNANILAGRVFVPNLLGDDDFMMYGTENMASPGENNENGEEDVSELVIFIDVNDKLNIVSTMELDNEFDINKVVIKGRSLELLKPNRKKALKHHLPTQLMKLHKEITTALDITVPIDYIEHYFSLGGSSCLSIKDYDEQNINVNPETCEKRVNRMNKLLKKVINLVQELSGELGSWFPIFVAIIRRAAETISLINSKQQSLLGAYIYIHTDGYSKVLKKAFGAYDYKSRFFDIKAESSIQFDRLFSGYQDLEKLGDNICKVEYDKYVDDDEGETVKLKWIHVDPDMLTTNTNTLGTLLEVNPSLLE